MNQSKCLSNHSLKQEYQISKLSSHCYYGVCPEGFPSCHYQRKQYCLCSVVKTFSSWIVCQGLFQLDSFQASCVWVFDLSFWGPKKHTYDRFEVNIRLRSTHQASCWNKDDQSHYCAQKDRVKQENLCVCYDTEGAHFFLNRSWSIVWLEVVFTPTTKFLMDHLLREGSSDDLLRREPVLGVLVLSHRTVIHSVTHLRWHEVKNIAKGTMVPRVELCLPNILL